MKQWGFGFQRKHVYGFVQWLLCDFWLENHSQRGDHLVGDLLIWEEHNLKRKF